MNRLPIVKKFLKGGEAESYEGVTIEWVRGMKPVLTIIDNGNKEEVALSKYDSLEALHALFQEKGFRKKEGGGGGTDNNKVSTAAKALKGETRLDDETKTITRLGKEKAISIGDGGGSDEVSSSEPAIYGLLTGAFIVGVLVYRRNRKKNARAVV